MSSFLATIATWGPSAYYSLAVASNTLFAPLLLKPKDPSKKFASKLFPEIFQKVEKLRKDVLLLGNENTPTAVAIGNNFGPAPVLIINKALANLDGDELNFFCKLELSHIINNDNFTAASLAAIASAVSTIAIPYLTSRLPEWAAPIAYSLPFLVGSNVHTFVMCVGEVRAYHFALQHASDEELVDVERFVRAKIEVNKSMHENYPLHFTKEGNVSKLYANSTKFSLTNSLIQIQFECQKRNVLIDNTPDLAGKMQQYLDFHEMMNKKIFKLS